MSRDMRRSYIILPIFGLLMGIFEGLIFYSSTGSLSVGFGVFVFFTLFMLAISLATIPIGRYFHRRAIDKDNKAKASNYDLRQENSVEIDMPYHQALETTKEAINAITGSKWRIMSFTYTITAKIHEVNPIDGTIKAGTKHYWRWRFTTSLWDDIRLNIRVEQINSQTSRVIIDTKPTNPIQIVDYGYTLNNINTIMRYLRQASAEENAIHHLSESASDETPQTDTEIQKEDNI